MKSAAPALMNLMSLNPQITALVGARIYSFIDPQEGTTFPDILVSPTVMLDTATILGMIPPYQERIAIECRDKTAAGSNNLGVAVRALLTNAVFRSNGVAINGCFPVSDISSVDEKFYIFRRIIDFRCWTRPDS